MRKKLLLFIVLAAACICPAAAQGIVVHQTDGSMTIIPSAKVDHISLVEEEDTYVFGTWHLGFWKNGDNVIKFDGTEITKMNTDELALFRRSNCGFVFQQVYLVDSMSVLDNIMAAGLLVYKDKRVLAKKAGELLKAVNIDETLWGKFPTQISGGEAQRVGIARALINDPKLVFADEPTGALNSQTGKAVLDTLTKFNEKGQSIVMVTHDISSARRGNRILYVKDGEIAGECNLGKYVTGDKERHQKLNDFLATMGW